MFSEHFMDDAESLILLFLEEYCTPQENWSSSSSWRGAPTYEEYAYRPSQLVTDDHLSELRAKSGGRTPFTTTPFSKSFAQQTDRSYPLPCSSLLNRTAAVGIAQAFFILERLLRHYRISSSHCCCTERSLYYRNPPLFSGGQMAVQRCLHRLCSWLDVCRDVQEDFDSHVCQREVVDTKAAWWEYRSTSSSGWWVTRAARKHIAHHVFSTSSLPPFGFLSRAQNFRSSATEKRKAKRSREKGEDKKQKDGKFRKGEEGVPFYPSRSTGEAGVSFCTSSHRAHDSALPGIEEALHPLPMRHAGELQKGRWEGYTREHIGVVANGKSILVGYLTFTVEENDCNRLDSYSASSTWNKSAGGSSSSSRVLSGMAHGAQGILLTSDMVLRCTHFCGISLPLNEEDATPLPLPLVIREARRPTTVKERNDKNKASPCSREASSIRSSSSVPNAAPSLFSSLHVLVVVEKECVLRTLLDTDHALRPPSSASFFNEGTHRGSAPWDSSGTTPRSSFFDSPVAPSRPFIFLCTKGYPCVAARLFLRRIHAAWPTLPLVVLTDGDPHGIGIVLSLMGLTAVPSSHNDDGSALFLQASTRWSHTVITGPLPLHHNSPTAPIPSSQNAVRGSYSYPLCLLPLYWLGIRPSELYCRDQAEGFSHSDYRYPPRTFHPATQAKRFLPITPSDLQVLHRLQNMITHHLTTLSRTTHRSTVYPEHSKHFDLGSSSRSLPHVPHRLCTTDTFPLPQHTTPTTTDILPSYTLRLLLRELLWIKKHTLKCEIEALFPDTPLSFLERSLQTFPQHLSHPSSTSLTHTANIQAKTQVTKFSSSPPLPPS